MAKCKGCDAEITWVKTDKGKMMPMNPDNTPHWGTCPAWQQFKKPAPQKT